MSELPPMPWDTTAYLSDTGHLSTLEHGAYGLILQAMWRSKDGTLDGSDAYLARACRMTLGRWKRIAPTIRALLTKDGNRVTQKRIQKERRRALSTSKAIPSENPNREAKPLKNIDPIPKTAPEAIPRLNLPLTTLELDSESEIKKKKKVRKCGFELPSDWRPADAERLYGRTVCRLPDRRIDMAAERMRRWAITNRHRAVALKSDWDLTFRNWLDREAGESSNGHGPAKHKNGFAAMMAELREEEHDGPTLDLEATLPDVTDSRVDDVPALPHHRRSR